MRFIGAAFGYFVLQPLVYIISLAYFCGEQAVSTIFLSDNLGNFLISMLPLSIVSMILNTLIILSWGRNKTAGEEKMNSPRSKLRGIPSA